MIHDTRLRTLNESAVNFDARYVLYWMQSSQRTRFNYALEYAIERANEFNKPLVVCFGLMDDFPEANERHYVFLLQGLRDVEKNLKSRGIKFVVKHGQAFEAALHYAKHAALVVCDRGYLRFQRRWRDAVADGAGVRVVQVEGDVVVPVETASNKHEIGARTLRPKIHRLWDTYLVDLKPVALKNSSLKLDVHGDIDVTDADVAIKKLKLDRSVRGATYFVGGEDAAGEIFKSFIETKLPGYKEGRNEPAGAQSSTMSGYLHYGHISPVELALAAKRSGAPAEDRDSYLEELIVRRELSMNFVTFNPKYDTFEGLPNWAQLSLDKHKSDPRAHAYSRDELERARTHDPYWNAAQLEMTTTGFMHNYMRMYWGKKILEWTPDPRDAYATTLYLNNKYFYCGRDPNAWANVAWIYGLHDRPWGPERKIFGLVRYMNAAGLERKFDIDKYVAKVAALK